jgi:hypothetical protein
VSAIAVAAVVFGCALAAAAAGIVLHARLPDDHLDGGSTDVVKLVLGLVATMSALVLGLLIASAQGTRKAQVDELNQLAAGLVQLDGVLAHYGPEALGARALLHRTVTREADRIWRPEARPASPDLGLPVGARPRAEALIHEIQALTPSTGVQRSAQVRSVEIAARLAQTRALMSEQMLGHSLPTPFLVVLAAWITVLFAGFGLFARPNPTVLSALFVGALSVAGAIYLVLELDNPYAGPMRISDAPLRDALARIGRD